MRPMPIIAKSRPRKRLAPARLLLGCPRVSPEWELLALHALMKPKEITKAFLRRNESMQKWKPVYRRTTEVLVAAAAARIGIDPALHFPPAGDFHFVIDCDSSAREELKMLGAAISSKLPGHWLTLGRVFIRGGHFFRRERGYKLNLTPARDVHLTRPLRAELRRLIHPERPEISP